MVHRTDFTSPGGPFGRPIQTSFDDRLQARRLRGALLIIGFAGLVLFLCVAVGLGLRDMAVAVWH